MTSNVLSSSTTTVEEDFLRDGMSDAPPVLTTVRGLPHGRMSDSGCVAEEEEWLMVMVRYLLLLFDEMNDAEKKK